MKRKCFFQDKLGQASVFYIIRSDEIDDFIAKNIISNKYKVDNNVESVITFPDRKFNDICMVKT